MSCYGIISIVSPFVAFYLINPGNEAPNDLGMFSTSVARKYYNLVMLEIALILCAGVGALYFLRVKDHRRLCSSLHTSILSKDHSKSRACNGVDLSSRFKRKTDFSENW